MRLLFFLGSGVSLQSGLPSTRQLTEEILRGEYHSDNAEGYRPGPERNEYMVAQNWVLPIQRFLRYLKCRVDAYEVLKGRRPQGNYEDIYYLLRQLRDELEYPTGNPAVEDFETDIRRRACEFLDSFPCPPRMKSYESYDSLLSRSLTFIEHVLWHKLSNPESPTGIDLIRDVAMSDKVDGLDIVTLNHDELLEGFLSREPTITVVDGFGDPDGGIRRPAEGAFNLNVPDGPAMRTVRLLKLHGSLGWYWDSISAGPCCVPRPFRNSFLDQRFPTVPSMLIGTNNKLSRYAMGIYLTMWSQFNAFLREHDLIVMCGYGGNDRGVNDTLLPWLDRPHKRILLLHRHLDEILRSNSPLWTRLPGFRKTHRLEIREKWLCEIGIGELMETIDTLPALAAPEDPSKWECLDTP